MLYVQPEMGRVVTQRLGSGRVLAVDGRCLAERYETWKALLFVQSVMSSPLCILCKESRTTLPPRLFMCMASALIIS